MTHEGSVMAAFQDGETRFVFARYRSETLGLYELADGTATASRAFTKAELFCPVAGCPTPAITTVNRKRHRDGFRHLVSSTAHAPESLFHIEGKAQIAKWARAKYPNVEVVEEQASNTARDRIADVMVNFANGSRVAIEIQYAALTPDAWQLRHDSYAAQGIRDVWLFGHHGTQLRAGTRENEVNLNPTHEALASTGSPVLWFNPGTLQIASATTAAQPGMVYLAATAGPGRLVVEDLSLFELTHEFGLVNPRLQAILTATAEWEANLTAQEVARLAAEAAERARLDELDRLDALLVVQNAASRARFAAVWPTTLDGKAILSRFNDAVPHFLNVDVAGAELPIPATMWQAHLYLTIIDPTFPGRSFEHLEMVTALLDEFGLEIPRATALRIVVAWCEALRRSGLLERTQSRLPVDRSDGYYKKPFPSPFPESAAPPRRERLDEPHAIRQAREDAFAETVRAAKEAARIRAAATREPTTVCVWCGRPLDPLLGTASDFHTTCEPTWRGRHPSQRWL